MCDITSTISIGQGLRLVSHQKWLLLKLVKIFCNDNLINKFSVVGRIAEEAEQLKSFDSILE